MDILLIDPIHGNRENNMPWGVLAIGSYLTNIGRSVTLLDANALTKSEFTIQLENLLPYPKLIGIGCFTTDTHYVKELVDYIKARVPHTKIIVGGPHSVLQPEQTCRYKNIDFVAYSDGEETVAKLIDEIAKPNPVYHNVPGLVYKDGNDLHKTSAIDFAGFYDINYDLLPEKTRNTFGDYIQVLTGRGCSYRCRFCYNSVICQKFHPRPVEDIIEELKRIVQKYNPKVVYFRDDNFFQDKQRIYDFIRMYKENNFKCQWRATCRANYFRPDYINISVIDELGEINCQCLKLGIESGNDRVLKYLRKGITTHHIQEAVFTISRSKIHGNYSFMVGLPNETTQEYIDTIEMIKYVLREEPSADIIGPQYFRIYPGGSLYDEIVNEYGYTEPTSFEEWAEKRGSEDDPFNIYREKGYPWIPKNGKDLASNASLLVLLYRKSLKDYLSLKRVFAIPFAILVKLRVKYGCYGHLYDVRLLAWLYKTLMPSAPPLRQ
ncbi:MAG: B12-binding domain-containing radical SAM protein [Bacteroidetes bacterium]|nr:B12-binding domain-containing radical SAM protein [Bacteroidota bacterium]